LEEIAIPTTKSGEKNAKEKIQKANPHACANYVVSRQSRKHLRNEFSEALKQIKVEIISKCQFLLYVLENMAWWNFKAGSCFWQTHLNPKPQNIVH
jgi:hypothetical protein